MPDWQLEIAPSDVTPAVELMHRHSQNDQFYPVGRFLYPSAKSDTPELTPQQILAFKNAFLTQGLQGVVDLHDTIAAGLFAAGLYFTDLSRLLDYNVRLAAAFGTVGFDEGRLSGIVKPYGAGHLADTDASTLRLSLLQQMRQVSVTPPDVYAPFPNKHLGDPESNWKKHTGLSACLGDSVEHSALEQLRKDMHSSMSPGQRAQIAQMDSPNNINWRVFTALHETSHYLSAKLQNIDLQSDAKHSPTEEVATHVLHRFEDPLDYARRLQKSPHHKTRETKDQRHTEIVAAKIIPSQSAERLADVSAALYMLSNYGDRKEVDTFLKGLEALRDALPMDIEHYSGNSIRYAVDAFDRLSANPQTSAQMHGLTIAQTTELATRLVMQEPDLNKPKTILEKDLLAIVEAGKSQQNQWMRRNLPSPGKTTNRPGIPSVEPAF